MEKRQNLALHVRLPFRVAYHEENGESVCTVRKDDLEGLYRANKRSSRNGLILGVAAIIFAVAYSYSALNPVTEYRIIDSSKLEKTIRNAGG